MKEKKSNTVKELACDFCHTTGHETIYDAPTYLGPWAHMCPVCFGKNTASSTIGTKLVYFKKEVAPAKKKLPVVEQSNDEEILIDGDRTVNCPECGMDHTLEPDAAGEMKCHNCETILTFESRI
jgi:hypothetical protein